MLFALYIKARAFFRACARTRPVIPITVSLTKNQELTMRTCADNDDMGVIV
jgi:hypothetical protein